VSLRDLARLRRAFGRLPAPESLLFAGPKRSNQEKWPNATRWGYKQARISSVCQDATQRGAAAAMPRALVGRGEVCLARCASPGSAPKRGACINATSSCDSTSLAMVPERSRHSGGNDSVSSELRRRGEIAPALGPDVLNQAISLGYFSLGQQRKVTRAPQASETPPQKYESPFHQMPELEMPELDERRPRAAPPTEYVCKVWLLRRDGLYSADWICLAAGQP